MKLLNILSNNLIYMIYLEITEITGEAKMRETSIDDKSSNLNEIEKTEGIRSYINIATESKS